MRICHVSRQKEAPSLEEKRRKRNSYSLCLLEVVQIAINRRPGNRRLRPGLNKKTRHLPHKIKNRLTVTLRSASMQSQPMVLNSTRIQPTRLTVKRGKTMSLVVILEDAFMRSCFYVVRSTELVLRRLSLKCDAKTLRGATRLISSGEAASH